MSVAVVGHVDHGKSTVIGRLLADTNALPEGKLEQVKETCARNAKPFEYAFLLDALKDEQAQGITIDMARCFFKTNTRRYLILDAPGHVEFLRNMITGAAKADAVLIVIDAKEGIRENSKRHGYIVSMLGIPQVTVIVNKMDLVDYDEEVFADIREEYTRFLTRLHVQPESFIPVSAMDGVNIASLSARTPWYLGPTVLSQFDAFLEPKPRSNEPFRLPLQDIYRFTEQGDDRRIFAGTVRTGSVSVGDRIRFLPSQKESDVASIEEFNQPAAEIAAAGQAIGLTLATQVYVRPGELMVRVDQKSPKTGRRFRANLFWMGRPPMVKGKRYKLKLGAASSAVELVDVLNVLDASELTSETNKQEVERHDVAECVFESTRPLAFDLIDELRETGRFVIIDNYEITGAGIILQALADDAGLLREHVRRREIAWKPSLIKPEERTSAYGHGAKFVVFAGNPETVEELARDLERRLFYQGFKVYYLRQSNILGGLDQDVRFANESRDEQIRRLGELARIMTDAGQIFLTALPELDTVELETLKLLNQPNEIVVANVGDGNLAARFVDLQLDGAIRVANAAERVIALLQQKKVILEYYI